MLGPIIITNIRDYIIERLLDFSSAYSYAYRVNKISKIHFSWYLPNSK